jgi:hypothetical protein
MRGAIPSWGDQRTLAGFWAHVTGAEYRYLVGIVPWSQRLSRIGFALRDLLTQPGPVGLLLAIGWGIPTLWRTGRPLALWSATLALVSLTFAVTYGGADGTVYLLPWTWAWCVWAGVGAGALLASLVAVDGRLQRGAVVGGLVMALVWTLVVQYPQMDLHRDTDTRDQALATLSALPRRALLVTADDASTFGTWYIQRALGARPDVAVIDYRLLPWPWYRSQLARVLGLADGQSVCASLQTSKRPILRLTPAGKITPATSTLFAPPVCPQ